MMSPEPKFEFDHEYRALSEEPGVKDPDNIWAREDAHRECYHRLRRENLIGPWIFRDFLALYDEVFRVISILPTMYAADILQRAHFEFKDPRNIYSRANVAPRHQFISDFLAEWFGRRSRTEGRLNLFFKGMHSAVARYVKLSSYAYEYRAELGYCAELESVIKHEMYMMMTQSVTVLNEDRYSETPIAKIFRAHISQSEHLGIMGVAHAEYVSNWGVLGDFYRRYLNYDCFLRLKYPSLLRLELVYNYDNTYNEAYDNEELADPKVMEVIAYQYLMQASRRTKVTDRQFLEEIQGHLLNSFDMLVIHRDDMDESSDDSDSRTSSIVSASLNYNIEKTGYLIHSVSIYGEELLAKL